MDRTELRLKNTRVLNTGHPLYILGRDAKVVEEYKYVGGTTDNRLSWKDNSTTESKKRCCSLYFLGRLRSLCVYREILKMFYQSVVAKTPLSSVVCAANDTHRLKKKHFKT